MSANSPTWRKSSYTTSNGGDCVELASAVDAVAIRDSKDPDGPKLVVNRRAFTDLLNRIRNDS